jgi:DNA-binding beta-propeller fold protein YncE
VSIGGHASDLALDEPRGVLYIANFTANRVEVMSLASNTIQTSINVAAQPSSVALSPDGRYLVVAHYGNAAPPASSASAITVIDLSNSTKRTFSLGPTPLGVAFGIDGLALVVTATDFLLLDPASGTTQELSTIAGLTSKTLPQPAASFPPNIVAASIAASADGEFIYGLGDKVLFRYDVTNRILDATLYSASPPLGPRAVSVSQDGSYFTAGWTVEDRSSDAAARDNRGSARAPDHRLG